MDPNDFSIDEQVINDLLVLAWNNFTSLKPTHPDHLTDFKNAIHDLQKVMGMRLLQRTHPNIYPTHDD